MVNPISKFWAKQMRLILKEDIETLPNLKRQAWEYVAYKTLKIIQTYKPYEKDWNWLSGDRYKESFIENYIHDVLHDQTHRTKKLRQQLAFLAFLDTDDYYYFELLIEGESVMISLTTVGICLYFAWQGGTLVGNIPKTHHEHFEEYSEDFIEFYEFSTVRRRL